MRFLLLCFCTVLALALPVRAQNVPTSPPAHIAFVEGSVSIDHNGESEAAALNMPVLAGDRIRTGNGRVTVMFPDGSSIDVDADSEVEFLTDTRVRVLAGTIEHHAALAPDAGAPSTQYLPSDLQAYGQTLDQNGAWQYESPYGYVWYPTVAADWRPYYYGYWSSVPRYGWTWIGAGAWAWPTHHYGRWGYAHSRWYWIPGRTYASAWVSWGTAPGYVSWCPLGYDGRAVTPLAVGYRSAWNAWTVLPRDRFGAGRYSAHRYAVEPYRLDSTTPFVQHQYPPARTPGRVVAVGPAPATNGSAIGVAVPRSAPAAPANDASYQNRGYRQPGDYGRAVDRQRTPDVARPIIVGQQPASGAPAPAPADHPAYRPNYAPTYTPNYDPAPRYRDRHPSGDPQARPNGQPSGSQRSTPGDARPPAADGGGRPERHGQPRESGPTAVPRAAPQSAAPNPPPSSSGNGPAAASGKSGGGQNDGGGSNARSPHAGNQSSGGTAVRRPR